MKQSLNCFILIAFLLCAIVGIAGACSCLPDTPSVKENFASSDLVFAGKVLELSNHGHAEGEVKFQISRVWKGQPTQTATFPITPGSSCMYNFSLGESYLIYGSWIEGTDLNPTKDSKSNWFRTKSNIKLDVSICGRTSIINGDPDPLGNSDIADLGAGYPPKPNPVQDNYRGITLFALACLTAGAIFLKLVKRI